MWNNYFWRINKLIIADKDKLRSLYGNDVNLTSNGIDLKLGKMFKLRSKGSVSINGKDLPKLEEIEPIKGYYWLRPRRSALVEVDEPIKIHKGTVQTYHVRSTLSRMGVVLNNSVGDSGYYGKLRFLMTNTGNYSFSIQQGSRFVQVLTHTTDNNESSYDGAYQEEVV
jgi:deoxycytidine triphosphate deaminase